MQLDLRPEIEAMIDEKVKAGYFSSPAAVVEEALRKLDEDHAGRLEEIRSLVRESDEAVARGEFEEYDAEEMPQLAAEISKLGRQRFKDERQK